MQTFRRLVQELHRRSIWQVLGIYVFGSWVAYQVVLGLMDGLGLPDWVAPLAVVLFVIGLPVVLATAFIQEGLPGAEPAAAREAERDRRESPGSAAPPAEHRLRGGARLFTWRGAITAGVLAFAGLGLGVTGFMGMRQLGIGPAGSLVGKGELTTSDHILVADFNPLTGDSALARVVAEAMRVDLTQSELLNVVDRSRIRQALGRMGRAGEASLGGDVAREVAFRLGVKAVVEGEVGVAGGAYLISATLVTPDSGRVLVRLRETAPDSTDLLPAVDRLSRRLRERAGESLRTIRANPPLTQVTTSSLPALRKYVRARDLSAAGDRPAAMALLEEALALDPEFASAHRSLAVHLWNRGFRGDSMFHHIDEALRLADRLTDYERHHTRGFRALAAWDLETARREYETLLAMDSADYVALVNLGVAYSLSNQKERALEVAERAYAAGDRAANTAYWNIVQGHLNLGSYEAADTVIARAAADHPSAPAPVGMRWLVAMARGDVEAADSAARRLAAHPDGRGWGQALRWFMSLQAGRLSAPWPGEEAAGAEARLHEAARLGYVDLFVRQRPEEAAARALRAVSDSGSAAVPMAERPYSPLALVLALAGREEAALELIGEFRRGVRPEMLRQHELVLGIAEGIARVARGEVDAGLERLRSARRVSHCGDCVDALVGIAMEAAARPDSAIAAYERYLVQHWADRHSFQGEIPNDPFIRAHVHERLAALYEDAGRPADARRHLAALVEQWADADPELQPRVRAARNRLERLAGEG